MTYKTICCMCGRETPATELIPQSYLRNKLGFVEIDLKYGTYKDGNYDFKFRSLAFCHSCSNKSYTINELKRIGDNVWSY